ncbi:hypothetical protein F4604DRAFT_1830739 [Suillus subluteus]|nr:hypothetical protein F4604DRAFT_1830739 [Suillus subluteus]
MRFTFAIIVVVAAALASSISATPIEGSTQCPTWCWRDSTCQSCERKLCDFPFCKVNPWLVSVSTFTTVHFGR